MSPLISHPVSRPGLRVSVPSADLMDSQGLGAGWGSGGGGGRGVGGKREKGGGGGGVEASQRLIFNALSTTKVSYRCKSKVVAEKCTVRQLRPQTQIGSFSKCTLCSDKKQQQKQNKKQTTTITAKTAATTTTTTTTTTTRTKQKQQQQTKQ